MVDPVTTPDGKKPRPAVAPWMFGALALILCLCLGWPAYAAYSWFGERRAEAAMTPVATAYLDALVKDDRPAGYALLCDRERQAVPPQRWSGSTHTQPAVIGYRILGARVEPNNEGPDGHYVDVELRYSDNTTRRIALPMADDPAGWKVCTQSAY